MVGDFAINDLLDQIKQDHPGQHIEPDQTDQLPVDGGDEPAETAHQYGQDLSADDGSSAGGHYAPKGHEHGGPHKAQHHAGDLGNIVADENGVAMIDKQSDDFELSDVIGRAFVVHAGTDDLTSQPSGDAGARAGLAVIGISK